MSQLLAIQLLTLFVSALSGFWLAWLMQERRLSRAQYEQQCARQVAIRAGCEARAKDERLSAIERTQVDILRALRETNKALCIGEMPSSKSFFTLEENL